jgi:hypothetical protein
VLFHRPACFFPINWTNAWRQVEGSR